MSKIIRNSIFVLGIFLFLICFADFASAKVARLSSLPIYGQPKYGADFSHFDYVNPKAPKGGKIVMPEYGGFDNFNPFIFKGIAASSVATLTLDSLGVIPVDDESTVYPLIAKEFEIPDDHSFVGFILDEKARFSDGSSVTADDVIFSFNSLIQKGSPFYRVYYADVD